MYKERMFTTWQAGLIHLGIVIVMPIIPIGIYIYTEGFGKAYLYALILTVIISFLYEYMSRPYKNCSKILKLENFTCCFTLTIMFLMGLFLLFLSFEAEKNGFLRMEMKDLSIILVAMFSVPVIITLIEIIRCFVYDYKSGNYLPDHKNLVRGAADV